MPNRIIRESALTSHSLAKLSDGAERLFWRLTIVADDAGRFDAYGVTVLARCFPVLADTLSPLKIGKWLAELSQDHVQFYEVNGRQYGQFRKWAEYQRSYGLKSKFPEPPADCGNVPQVPADSRSYPISENRDTRSDIRETRGVPAKRGKVPCPVDFSLTEERRAYAVSKGFTEAEVLFEAFLAHHRANGNQFLDWDAAWQKWVQNEKKYGKPRTDPGEAKRKFLENTP